MYFDIYKAMTYVFIVLSLLMILHYIFGYNDFVSDYYEPVREVNVTNENGAIGIAGEWHYDYTDGKTL